MAVSYCCWRRSVSDSSVPLVIHWRIDEGLSAPEPCVDGFLKAPIKRKNLFFRSGLPNSASLHWLSWKSIFNAAKVRNKKGNNPLHTNSPISHLPTSAHPSPYSWAESKRARHMIRKELMIWLGREWNASGQRKWDALLVKLFLISITQQVD